MSFSSTVANDVASHSPTNRINFIDHLRGIVVAIMVMDHAVQGYAARFGRFWFLADPIGDEVFDALHMISNAFIMPALFFLAGMFVLPSLQRRGVSSFFKERFIRIGIPFVIGIPLLVPLMSFPRYVLTQDPNISYLQFLQEVFFTLRHFQAGPFWFLWYLMALTVLVVTLHYALPIIIMGLTNYARWFESHPLWGLGSVAVISALLIGPSDLQWGAPWWISYQKLFAVQGSRFLLQAFYFLLGVGFSSSGLIYSRAFLKKVSEYWLVLILMAIIVGVIYISYSLNYYYDGAYCHARGGFFKTLVECDETLILVRTTLHGVFCALIVSALFTTFYKFFNEPSEILGSLAVCSYGIYLLHEVMTVGFQYAFYEANVPLLIKFLIAWGGPMAVSWWLTAKIFRKLPLVRRVF